MRAWVTLSGLVAFSLLATPRAEGQYARSRYYNRPYQRRPQVTNVAPPRRRDPVGTFSSNRYRGIQTRGDWLRAASKVRRERRGLLRDPRPSASPIRQLLDRRNLLRSRSALGRQSGAAIGRYDYLPNKAGGMRGDVDLWPTPQGPRAQMPERIDDYLAARLAKKADECFELGIAYFRNGDLTSARNCFELVRDLQRDRPRAFIADVFVSYEKADYNQAVGSLFGALERAETLDDLKIDRFIERFYEGDDFEAKRGKFRRTVESVNLFVTSQSDPSSANMLLAYYAWLNGDLVTAITAAEIAEEVVEETWVPHVERFHRLLIEARDEAAASSTGT